GRRQRGKREEPQGWENRLIGSERQVMLQTPVGNGKPGLDEVDSASGGPRYRVHGTSQDIIAVLTLPNGCGRRLYLISEWPRRRKLYRGHDNEAKPRSVSGSEGGGEARRMSKARGWQTRGDGRGSREPPFRTRITLRAAVLRASARIAIPPICS